MPGLLAGLTDFTRRFYGRIYESQYGAPGPFNQARPNADPSFQTALSLFSLNNTSRLLLGTITDTALVAGAYRVSLESFKQPVAAVLATNSTSFAGSVKDLALLRPGTQVICLWHQHLPRAIILGAIPPINLAAQTSLASILLGATRQRVDDAHKLPLRTVAAGHIADMLSGRPMDLTGDEKGWITESGMRVVIDPRLLMLGLNEASMLTFFAPEGLVRLAAYHLQQFTAGMEREGLNDQGEYSDWEGYTPYPWEQMGQISPERAFLRELSSEQWQNTTPAYSKMEPADDYAMPWHRERVFRGYLGNLHKHITQGPPQEGEYTCFAGGNGATPAIHPGLFESTVTMNGRFLLRAATSVSISKHCGILSPVRLRKPEQPVTGDNPANYKFAGLYGDGPAHTIAGSVRATHENPDLQRAAALADSHAYLFNYNGVHPFAYHTGDYYLPEQSDLSYVGGQTCAVLDFSELAQAAYLSAATTKQSITIDHRNTSQDVYTTRCGVDLLEDGGVFQYDGYGATILMACGHIVLSAPGDIWMRSGRNTNIWAGADLIVRAKENVDVSATNGDGRFKFDRDLRVVTGVSGEGGMLFENKAAGVTRATSDIPTQSPPLVGINFKAAESDVSMVASRLYLHSAGGGDAATGDIYFNAGGGNVYTQAANHLNYLTGQHALYFGTHGETPTRATVFGGAASLIGSELLVDGPAIIAGSIVGKGNILLAEGTIATEAAQSSPYVAPLGDLALTQVNDALATVQQYAETLAPADGATVYEEALEQAVLGETGPGHEEIITATAFAFRDVVDYHTQDFYIFEDRWQQLGRLAGKGGVPWAEKPVRYRGRDTYPYPGGQFYVGSEGLVEQDLALFDPEAQRDRDVGRGEGVSEAYKNPVLTQPRTVSLQNYTVIR